MATKNRSPHCVYTLLILTFSKSYKDLISAESAQSAYWSVLSIPPFLLVLLGSLAHIAPLFSPNALNIIEQRMIVISSRFVPPVVFDQIIEPTIADIDHGAHIGVISLGFVLSLWSGSAAVLALMNSVIKAHGQDNLRRPIQQRLFALFLYINMIVIIIIVSPCITLGPKKVTKYLPDQWVNILQLGYYPVSFLLLFVAITALYRFSLPLPLPTIRLLSGSFLATSVFMIGTAGLRLYLAWTTTTGHTYGALAAPISLLLCAFLGGFSVMIGAELNAVIQEHYPVANTCIHH